MPLVEYFRDGGGTDFRAWRQDMKGRFLADYKGQAQGVSAHELTRIYFGRGADLEDDLLTRQQVQLITGQFREAGVLLVNRGGVYFIAEAGDTATAKDDIAKFAKRQVRGQQRLQERVEVAHQNYALPSGGRLAKAIEAADRPNQLIARELGLPAGAAPA